MNHQVIEEYSSGEISIRVVQLDKEDITSRKYWLQAGFGHLELDWDGIEDIAKVLGQLVKRKRIFK